MRETIGRERERKKERKKGGNILCECSVASILIKACC